MKETIVIFLLVSNSVFCFFTVASSQGWEWQNPLPQGNTLSDIYVLDTNNTITVGDAGTVMRTSDGGESWIFNIMLAVFSSTLSPSVAKKRQKNAAHS